MARITRKTQIVFGESLAATPNIAKFGSNRIGVPAYSLDLDEIQTEEYKNGWGASLTSNKALALQDLNALHYMHSAQTAYLMQQGIAEWDAATPYFIGSTVVDAVNTGKQYVAIADSTNVAVSDFSKWKPHGPSLPLGSVIATFPSLSGAYVCTAVSSADSEGFVLCNDQTVSDTTSPMNGVHIPFINNDVFLMGNAVAGTAGGANTKNLSHTHDVSVAMPAHTHNLDANGGAATTSTSIDLGSPVNVHAFQTAFADCNASYACTKRSYATPNGNTAAFSNTVVGVALYGVTSAISSVPTIATTTGAMSLTTTFDIRPKYITAVYLMRIR